MVQLLSLLWKIGVVYGAEEYVGIALTNFMATVSRVDASAYARRRQAISAAKALPAFPDGILNQFL